MTKYYNRQILFCGVLRKYNSLNIVAITYTVTLQINRFTLLFVFN